MHVEVEVVCLPHPEDDIKAALRMAGEELALTPDSVSVKMDSTAPRTAILEFEMRQAAQYGVVDDIAETVKHWGWQFYQEITIRFC